MEFLVFRSRRFQQTQLVNKNEQLKCKRWYLFWSWKWFFPAGKGRPLPQKSALPGPSCSQGTLSSQQVQSWTGITFTGKGRGGGLLLDGFGVIHSSNLQHSHRILNYSLPQKSACVLTYGAEEDKEGTVVSPSSMYLTNSLYTLWLLFHC